MNKKFLIIILVCSLLFPVTAVYSQDDQQSEIQKIIGKPSLQQKYPGLDFSKEVPTTKEGGTTYLVIPYLGEYISAIYRWSVAAGGILAVIVIIVSAIQWMFPAVNLFTEGQGEQQKTINKAKKRILRSITGLVILASSYTLLYTINPELVKFDALKVKYIEEEPIPAEETAAVGVPAGKKAQTPSNIEQINPEKHFDPSYTVNGEGVNGIKIWNNFSEKEKKEVLPHLFITKNQCYSSEKLTRSINIKGVSNPNNQQIHKEIIDNLKQAGELANKLGFRIQISSGRRTLNTQARFWNTGVVARYKQGLSKSKWSRNQGLIAKPSCKAPHITGGAIDMNFTGTNLFNVKPNNQQEYRDIYFNKNLQAFIAEEIMRRADFVRYCQEGWHFETKINNEIPLRYHAGDTSSVENRCAGMGPAYKIWSISENNIPKQKINSKIKNGNLFEKK